MRPVAQGATAMPVLLLLVLFFVQHSSRDPFAVGSLLSARLTRGDFDLGLRAVSRSPACPVVYEFDPPARASANRTTSRIVNGDSASEKVAPSLVAWLKKRDGKFSFSCTGTLVSSRWVITAAHCEVGSSGFDKAVLLMRNTYEGASVNANAMELEVEAAFNHEQYLGDDSPESQQHDIAAIKLAADAPAGAVPMKVNVNIDIPKPHSFIRVIGFGVTANGDYSNAPRPLAQVDVPVTSTNECAKIHQDVSNVDIEQDTHVCTGYVGRGGCGSCRGDSGGPLIQYETSGDPVLVAVTSVGVSCAHSTYPTVNLRVANFRAWLDDVAGVEYVRSESTDPIFFDAGLSLGAIVGIVTGVVILTVLAIAAVFIVRERRRQQLPPSPAYPYGQQPPSPGMGGGLQRPSQSGTMAAAPVQATGTGPAGTQQQPHFWDVGIGQQAPSQGVNMSAAAVPGLSGAPSTPPPQPRPPATQGMAAAQYAQAGQHGIWYPQAQAQAQTMPRDEGTGILGYAPAPAQYQPQAGMGTGMGTSTVGEATQGSVAAAAMTAPVPPPPLPPPPPVVLAEPAPAPQAAQTQAGDEEGGGGGEGGGGPPEDEGPPAMFYL